MARFPRIASVPNRAARCRGRRSADARSLGLEHLDRRQMLSANAMVSFADTGSILGREIKSMLPQTERAWTGGLGAIATQGPKQLAANPTVSLSKGVLTVTGTSAADNLEVRQTGDRIEIVGANVRQPLPKVGGATSPFTVQDGTVSIQTSMVQQIRINAGSGNDTVKVNVDAAMAKKVFADLGQGTDTLKLPMGGTLGSQTQAEAVNYFSRYTQEVPTMEDFRKDLSTAAMRGTLQSQRYPITALTVTRTADGYTISWVIRGCFGPDGYQQVVPISDADLAGVVGHLSAQQSSALKLLHGVLSEPQSPLSEYGKLVGYDGPRTMDFKDGDGDGIDDRDQLGPGQPRVPTVPESMKPLLNRTDLIRSLPVFEPNKAWILPVIVN